MSSLKPFSLPEALAGKAVKLRNGEKAHVRHHETELPVPWGSSLVGYTEDGAIYTWHTEGYYIVHDERHDYDIIGMYPETRTINGFEVPVPESVPPQKKSVYYAPSLYDGMFHVVRCWLGEAEEIQNYLPRGLVFLNAEDAIANAKAMLGINPYEGDKS